MLHEHSLSLTAGLFPSMLYPPRASYFSQVATDSKIVHLKRKGIDAEHHFSSLSCFQAPR